MSAYRNEFSSWADVVSEFSEGCPGFQWGSSVKCIKGAPAKEPEEVLWADYETEGYDGSALVIYRQGDKVFEVSGSHCSCYGLEGQWEPEEYDIATYIAAVEKRRYPTQGAKIAAGKLKLVKATRTDAV